MEPTMPSILTAHCCFWARQYDHTYPSVAKQRDKAAKLRCQWVQHNQVHWELQIAAISLLHWKAKANILSLSFSLTPSHGRIPAFPCLSASILSLLIPHLTSVFFHRLFPTLPNNCTFLPPDIIPSHFPHSISEESCAQCVFKQLLRNI